MMKPVRTVTFALLVLADLSLVLLVPFVVPAPKPPLPKITITAPANSLKPGSGLPPTDIQCDGDDVRTPWCEARYTNVI
jgi:hypothetical protein